MKFNELWDNNTVFQQLLKDINSKNKKQIQVKGLQGSAGSFLIASLMNELKSMSPLLVLTKNKENMLHFFQDIINLSYLKENRDIIIFPSYEVLPYEDINPDIHITEQRMKALSEISPFSL